MNELAHKGKIMTIRVFASMLLISIYTIVTYNIVVPNVETKKLIQQIVRFSFTVLIMYFVFQGKTWAKNLMSFLCGLAIVGGLISIFTPITFVQKIPLIVMTLIYSFALYHFNFSQSFKEYFNHLTKQ
ncbi:hypothetical protein [Emticicia oligotrophica]|uniref:hypothetical protein n=1 Tax=Emticicia oligotrophica TaxID=312279 RepID=UPI00273CF497|nr:hypothetical protein [Emticicia oligotrophica]